MSVFIFVGSTLSHAKAKTHLDATYLPPVQQGDVLRVLAQKPRVIGIVDGLFRTVPAVWHKEILVALEQGVHVFGAASMGALRAAELARFGMRGVGRIYEQFANGTLEDDDEVAVAHASEEFGFRELSVAMVNVRDAVEQAVAAAVIDAAEGAELIRHAKAAHYTRRTLSALVPHAPESKKQALASFFASFGPSLKQRDAIAMLEAIGAFLKDDPRPFEGAHTVEQTPFLAALWADAESRRTPRRVVKDGEAGVPLWALRKEGLMHILARDVAERLGIAVTADELAGARKQFADGGGVEEGMTPETRDERLRDIIRLQKLEEHYRRRIDVELPDLAAVLSAFMAK